MRRLLPAALPVIGFLLTGATSPSPVPGGLIGTLQQGRYTCELPGDAGGPVRVAANDFDFNVIRGSSYRIGRSRGSYLLTGDLLTMTGGKLKGMRFHRVSDGFLRKIEANGSDGEMRCVLGTAGNGPAAAPEPGPKR